MNRLQITFVHEQFVADLRKLFAAQRDIAVSRIYRSGGNGMISRESGSTVRSRTGRLMKALENPSFENRVQELGYYVRASYPTYIRLLDMKERGNFKIYNRQIWGVLYNETLPEIKYGYRGWLERNFPQMLDYFNQQKK